MIDKKQPIIIKKVFHGGHGHHGGAWKVAFADFVTAMMAFFMLMWLMGSTTKEERAAISEYFDNPSMSKGVSSTPAPSAVQGPGGASTSLINLGGALDMPKEEQEKQKLKKEKEKEEQEQEKKQLDNLMDSLKDAIEKSETLKPFKEQLLLDITDEGLRIQIVDKENRPMFASGDATLKHYTYDILRELARYMSAVPNHISITGHTDATPFRRENYGNWELSADRANAARRVLVDNGVAEEKVGRVVGLASSVLFDKADPKNPVNRRISIIVMNKKTEEAISKGEAASEALIEEHGSASPANVPLPEPGKSDRQLLPGDGAGTKEGAKSAAPPPQKSEPKPAAPLPPAMNLPMEYL